MSKIIDTLKKDFAKAMQLLQTPAGEEAMKGAVAIANFTQPAATGQEKHFTAASIIQGTFGVCEAVAHLVVKAAIDFGIVQAPVLAPIADQIEKAADAVIDQAGAKAAAVVADKLAPKASADAVPPTPGTKPQAPTETPEPVKEESFFTKLIGAGKKE